MYQKKENPEKQEQLDPAGYKEEFKVPGDEMPKGKAIGYMRFVVMELDEPDPVTGAKHVMLADGNPSEFTFFKVLVDYLAESDDMYRRFSVAMEAATAMRKLNEGDIMGLFETLGKTVRERTRSRRFPSGGFGDGLSELRDFLTGAQRHSSRKFRTPDIEMKIGVLGGDDLAELMKFLRENDDDETDTDTLAAIMRKATGGKGCDCDECRAEQARVAKEKAEKDQAPPDIQPTQN